MKRRFILFIAIPLFLSGLLAFTAYLFQDNLSRFFINPRTPFQTTQRPAAPIYNVDQAPPSAESPNDAPSIGAWALLPTELPQIISQDDGQKPADIFYVHGDGYYSKTAWNGAIDDPDAELVLQELSLPNEIGPFFTLGNIYAPRYRQATLFSRFTHKYDGIASLRLAYSDVCDAFEYYLTIADPERPLILVGYEQGGLHIMGILKEYFAANKSLSQRLAAAYIIDYGVAKSTLGPEQLNIKACTSPQQTGCLISFNGYEASMKHEITRIRQRTLLIDTPDQFTTITDDQMVCINPLSWSDTDRYIGPENHLGGASASGLKVEQTPPMFKEAVGAQCINGVLIIDKPSKRFLRSKRWFGQQWRAKPYNLFYADLREDAQRRIERHRPILAQDYRQLDPIAIDGEIELNDSPIKTVPN